MLAFIRESPVDASSPAVECWNHLWFAPVTEFIYNLLFSRTKSAKSFVGFLISFDAADWTLWSCHWAGEAGSAPSTYLGLTILKGPRLYANCLWLNCFNSSLLILSLFISLTNFLVFLKNKAFLSWYLENCSLSKYLICSKSSSFRSRCLSLLWVN